MPPLHTSPGEVSGELPVEPEVLAEPSLNNPAPIIPPPSPAQQSWGVIISIIIIVLMIIIGAFYAWGQRIAAERALIETASSTANTY